MTLSDVNIKVPSGMAVYLKENNGHMKLEQNALILYPYIQDRTISHGKAAEILGISKCELIELYDKIGLPYLSLDISEAEMEVSEWERRKVLWNKNI